MLDVPAGTARARSYYWDGTLRPQGTLRPLDGSPFDLTALDPVLLRRALGAAGRLVGAPTTSYAVVRAPDDDGAFLWGYASDEAGRTGYVSFTRDGRAVRSVPPSR